MKPFGYAVLLFALTVTPAFAASEYAIPSYAKSSGDLVPSSHWIWGHDKGTPGSATGSSHYPISKPSLDGKAREFAMSYTDKAGVRFSLTFGHNSSVTHFVYDTWVYIDDPKQLANLEMDMNQVMSNGKTVIYGFQCSNYSHSWEYAYVANGGPHWHATSISCSPEQWTAYKWHHVQIAEHRNSSGDVTYDWVNFDGKYSTVNKGGFSALSLHWTAGDLNLNFQLDGATSRGTVTMFADKLVIYYW